MEEALQPTVRGAVQQMQRVEPSPSTRRAWPDHPHRASPYLIGAYLVRAAFARDGGAADATVQPLSALQPDKAGIARRNPTVRRTRIMTQ